MKSSKEDKNQGKRAPTVTNGEIDQLREKQKKRGKKAPKKTKAENENVKNKEKDKKE